MSYTPALSGYINNGSLESRHEVFSKGTMARDVF